MVNPVLHWDLFCRVIDNFGDVGVCWRLACDLAARGQRIRLWLDDRSALAWMAPDGATSVEVCDWNEPLRECEPGDVVIEAFGCSLPDAWLQRMAARQPAPLWINLEYLSAESYVERSHGLRSPQFSGPAAGLDKWFFYPGFTQRTGGLIREADLFEAQAHFDKTHWLAGLGLALEPGERLVSLFCYDNPALPTLLADLSRSPCLLLVAPGAAATQLEAQLGAPMKLGMLRAQVLPLLSQTDFDRLLWASDLNFVRGEDSFVRAQWAGQPFVWHIYPQHDAAHAAKLEAFLDLYLAGAPGDIAAAIRDLWRAWNGLQPWPEDGFDIWHMSEQQRTLSSDWRQKSSKLPDLSSQLLGFLAKRR